MGLEKIPPLIGKYFLRFLTSSKGSAIFSVQCPVLSVK
jgi:hypothetical protein